MTPPEWFMAFFWPGIAVLFAVLIVVAAIGAITLVMELFETLAATRRRNHR